MPGITYTYNGDGAPPCVLTINILHFLEHNNIHDYNKLIRTRLQISKHHLISQREN